MDAIQLLKREHQKAKAAFGALLEAEPAKRGAQWEELQPELKAHEEIEEACLYGPLSEERLSDEELAEWATDEHQEDVDEVESLIEKAQHLDPKEAGWIEIVREIHSALEAHIRREEDDIFPRIAKAWETPRLEKVGEEMRAMKIDSAGRR
jgi:hemerythrin-like domain-containing protein